MPLLQRLSEGLARKTSRRGLFGRGAEVATGALLGAAAGSLTRPGRAAAAHTVCNFPIQSCPCDGCRKTGLCAKPCMIDSTYYAAGCWVTGGVNCCDCDCQGLQGVAGCGCGSDYHNDPANCP